MTSCILRGFRALFLAFADGLPVEVGAVRLDFGALGPRCGNCQVSESFPSTGCLPVDELEMHGAATQRPRFRLQGPKRSRLELL